MKWIALALVLVGCSHKGGEQPAGVSAEYRADIDNLCDAVQRSGAADIHDDQRISLIAIWLGSNIHTAEGKAFLVKIQPLQGEAKAKALEDEAKRAGLDGCALASEWRK